MGCTNIQAEIPLAPAMVKLTPVGMRRLEVEGDEPVADGCFTAEFIVEVFSTPSFAALLLLYIPQESRSRSTAGCDSNVGDGTYVGREVACLCSMENFRQIS